MKIRFAAVLYAAFALALVAFAGTALAGNGNGGNSANAPGHQKQDSSSQSASSSQTQSSSTSAPAPATAAPATHGNSASAPGRTKHASTASTTKSSTGSTKHQSTAGVKPSNQTNSVKPTSAPASSDKTKLYGNGKTAGQIATSAGYPDAVLYGPGNSQPHKYNCGGHYVDVHALKAKGKKCAPATSGTLGAQKTEEHVAATAPCTATKTVTETQSGGVEHFIGPKASGRFVVIHPSTHSAHYRDKHPDVILPSSTVTHTVVIGSTACSTTTQSFSSSSSASVSAQTASASTTASAPAAAAAAPAAAAPTAAGGVLGAVTPLHSAKPKASAGVLGSTVRLGKKVGGTTLPFTGLQLWIFAAVALGLILVGAFTRRASANRI